MCTIVAASRVHPDLGLVVAANRDEFLQRAALPPREVAPGVWAGIDAEKGGSWLGATRAGFFVGLTNQHSERNALPAPRSRGEIVMEALLRGTIEGLSALLGAINPDDYNPFNLLFGDARRLLVAYSWKGPRVEVTELGPGLHVLANDELHSPLYPKTRRAEELSSPLLRAPWPALSRGLAEALADHQKPSRECLPRDLPSCDEQLIPEALELQALCVHMPSRGYGTRSASLVAASERGLERYLFADGSPCTTAFADVLAG